MGPKKGGSSQGGSSSSGATLNVSLPEKALAVNGVVKLVFEMTKSCPVKGPSGSLVSRGRANAAWFKVILHHVEEEQAVANTDMSVVRTPTGKANAKEELEVVFIGDYAKAAQHIRTGNRLKVCNFVVSDLIEKDATDYFKFDLTADSATKDPERSFTWEYQDKDDKSWKPAYRAEGAPIINDRNLKQAINRGDEISDFLDAHMTAPPGAGANKQAHGSDPDPDYVPLSEVKVAGPKVRYSAYGVISEYSQWRSCAGKDKIITMTVIDESRPEGLRCSFLLPPSRCPVVRNQGDIVRIRRFVCQDFQDVPQGQADPKKSTVFTLVSGEKPKQRGPDDLDEYVVSGGVYKNDSKQEVDMKIVEKLRAFSKKYFSDPERGVPDEYQKRINALPSLSVPFDLYCQLVDYKGMTDLTGDFVKLEVRDGTDLPGSEPQCVAEEVASRARGKDLVVGTIFPVFIHKDHEVLKQLLETGEPGRWAWLKIRAVSMQTLKIDPDAVTMKPVCTMQKMSSIMELSPFHPKVKEMLEMQNKRIDQDGVIRRGKTVSSSQHSSSSSQAGKTAGKRALPAASDAPAAKKQAQAKGNAGGLEESAARSVTEAAAVNKHCGYTAVADVVKITEIEPVNKFRVCVRLGNLPDSNLKTRPGEVGQMIKFSNISEKWIGNLALYLEDNTGGFTVAIAGADFEKFFGVKCSDCTSDQGKTLGIMEQSVKKLTAKGAVMDCFVKSYKSTKGKVVFNIFDTKLK